jgi:hypothetical protein
MHRNGSNHEPARRHAERLERRGSALTRLINREIRRLKPDLVSFQEVVRKPDVDQLAHLIDGTGLHGTHQADLQPVTPPFFDRYGGGAVASRWPYQPLEVLDLRLAGANDVPWATLAVSIVIPDLGEMLFIGATVVGGVVTVTMSFLLYMERPWPQVLAVSVMAALIGTLLFTMALLSRPFLGPLAIDPTPFEQSISVFDDVDHGF